MKRSRLYGGLLGVFGFFTASTCFAESSAKDYAKGFHLGSGPQVLIPTDGGPLGFGLDAEARFGIGAGDHLVIAPGLRASGYIISQQAVGLVTPVVRFSFPVGPLGPYLFAGAGPGFRHSLELEEEQNFKTTGFAFIGGAGLMIHLGKVVAIGAEGAFEKIFATDFQVLAVKPVIEFGFL